MRILSFAGSLGGALALLQRIEILAPLLIGVALATYLILRRGKKRDLNSEMNAIKVVGAEEEPKAGEEKTSEKDLARIEKRALEALKAKGALRPSPIAASSEGGHYPDIAGASLADVERTLKGLVERGLALEGETEFSVVSCPICGSCGQVALISCKNCGSLRVREIKYYKHTCGYIGPESSFRTEDGRLVCPQCKSSEGIERYHKKYYCLDCKTESDEANIVFKCGSCGATYDESNMALKTFKKIELSREALNEYEKISRAISAQVLKLQSEGYAVKRPAALLGESGVTHNFEAVARKGEEVIAITSAFGEPLIQTLFKLGVARSDLKISKIILITGKPIGPAERSFAKSLGIDLVEAS